MNIIMNLRIRLGNLIYRLKVSRLTHKNKKKLYKALEVSLINRFKINHNLIRKWLEIRDKDSRQYYISNDESLDDEDLKIMVALYKLNKVPKLDNIVYRDRINFNYYLSKVSSLRYFR